MTNTPEVRATFEAIYAQNTWVFGSGAGSLVSATIPYRDWVETFLRTQRIDSVVDYGCGDWQFSQLIDWRTCRYLGLDIAESVVRRNAARHTSRTRRFDVPPLEFRDIPEADLLIVKDVFQHWPTAMIHKFLADALPRFRFALITNCDWPEHLINTDIELGGWRPLDLSAGPFQLQCRPVLSFEGKAPPPVAAPWRKKTVLVERA